MWQAVRRLSAAGAARAGELVSAAGRANAQVQQSCSLPEVCAAVAAFAASQPKHGHVAFINATLQHIDRLGLQIDVPTADALLSVFPTENSFSTKSLFDALWPADTLQGACAMHILQRMEEGFVIPEASTYDILFERFGRASQPVKKCRQLAYWLRRFSYANPFFLPPSPDAATGARRALERIARHHDDVQILDIVPQTETSYGFAAHSPAQLAALEAAISSGAAVRIAGPEYSWAARARHGYLVMAAGPECERDGHIVGLCMASTLSVTTAHAWLDALRDRCPDIARATSTITVAETTDSGAAAGAPR